MPLQLRVSLASTVKHCKGLLHYDWPNMQSTFITPIRAQTLLLLSSALLGDLLITSLHALTQTETCKDMHAHRKKGSTVPPQKTWEEPTLCFCDALTRSVTVMWPYSMQTSQQGLKRGERACVFVSVQVFSAVCAETRLWWRRTGPGTEEQPCTLPDPCSDEYNMITKAEASPAQPGMAQLSTRTHDYLMTTARAEARLLLASVCFLQPQRMNRYPCELTWMNFDRGNMGQSALCCWSMICDCTLLNRGEMRGHKNTQVFSVAPSSFSPFSSCSWCWMTFQSKTNSWWPPPFIHFKCYVMAKDPFLEGLVHREQYFLFMKHSFHSVFCCNQKKEEEGKPFTIISFSTFQIANMDF